MDGTTLTQTQFALLSASVLQCLPEGMTLDVSDSWRNNHEELRARLAFLAETAPPSKRRGKKKALPTYNEAQFFQTRPGLWVDSDLENYVGLEIRANRGKEALKHFDLDKDTSECEFFGSPERLIPLSDLGQIGQMIDEQWGGRSGRLLNNGKANLFLVRGKDGSLRVVHVRWDRDRGEWDVFCRPFDPALVRFVGDRVFSN